MEEIKLPLQSVTKVIGLDTVDSTQSLAKVLAQQGAEDGSFGWRWYRLRFEAGSSSHQRSQQGTRTPSLCRGRR